MPLDDQNSGPEARRPHGWWILPAAIIGILLLACLIMALARFELNWLQRLGG